MCALRPASNINRAALGKRRAQYNNSQRKVKIKKKEKNEKGNGEKEGIRERERVMGSDVSSLNIRSLSDTADGLESKRRQPNGINVSQL